MPRTLNRLTSIFPLAFGVSCEQKLLIGFYQISTRVEKVYDVFLPHAVRNMLASFALPLSFGIGDLSLACMWRHGFEPRLILSMCAPVVFLTLVVIFELLRTMYESATVAHKRDEWASRLLARLLPTTLRLAFLCYPVVTNVAFEAFSCTTPFEDGSQWLISDVSLRCSSLAFGYVSPEHERVMRLAWIAIGAYPLGILAVNALLLLRARSAIMAGKETLLSLATTFLHREFKPTLFYWELMEMARRFLLVGLFVIQPYRRGSMMQLALATIVSSLYLIVQLVAMPYRHSADNLLALACSTNLAMLFLGCILYKYDALSSTPEIVYIMGNEQRAMYKLEEVELTGILIACVMGTLVACAFIIVAQFYLDMKRRRVEALASIARRLRYCKSKQEVSPPSLAGMTSPDGDPLKWHVFLSHTWAQGQSDMRVVKTRLVEMLPGIKVHLPPSTPFQPARRIPCLETNHWHSHCEVCLDCLYAPCRCSWMWTISRRGRVLTT